MADLGAIEIPIVVRDNQLKSAVNTTNRLERELTRLVKAVDSNSVSEERYRQTLIKVGRELKSVTQLTGNQAYGAVVRYTNAKQKQIAATATAQEAIRREADEQKKAAAAMKQAFREKAAATKEQAAAAARVTAEEERLRLKYVQGHAAMEVYSRELNDLAMARKKDIISSDQQKQAVAELNIAMANGTGAFATMGAAAQVGGRRMSGTGMAIQQTGYQVGDFLVQVQGGTNAMVAFGQQATQLVGVLPMVAGSFGLSMKAAVGLSAGLGIAIPLLTAIGAFFMRSSKEAKEAADGVDELESSVKSLESSVKDFLLTKKAASLGITKEELLGIDNIEAAEKALGEAVKKLEEYQSVSGALGGAGYQQIFLAAKSLFVDAEGEHLAAIEAVISAETLLANLRLKQADERFKNFDKERVELEEQLAMAQEIARFGEDSNQVAKLALEQRIASFDRSIDQQVAANELADYQGAQLKEINAELARSESSYETIEDKVQRISGEIEAATQFKLSDVFETASRAIDGMNSRLATTLSQLGGIMSSINSVLIDTVAVQAESEALAAGKSATEAANAARVAREVTRLTGTGNAEDLTLAEAAAITALTEALERNGVASDKLKAQQDALRDAAKGSKKSLEDLKKEVDKLNKTAAEGLTPFDKYNTALKNLDVLRAAGLSDAAYSMEIERLNDELAKSLPMVNDVADAFGDFLARGLTDFKSFANSIFKSFQNMLAQMITTAARNRILISMGATGSMAGPASAASNLAQGAGMLGGVGAFASGIGSGLGVVGSGFMAGGLSGAATATAGAVSGGIGMGGAAGFGTALGAAIPVIGAVALVFGALRKTTKELDSGLNVTVKNMDALVTSFKTVQTSRFFGLSKKTSTSTGEVSSGVSDPIVAAVQQIQQSVLTAAEAFGFGADAFDNFSYEFKLSLKGLSEEQQMQKINEELTKMGDSFASLTGHFSSMNELLEAAEQRYQIENRMLQALGNSSELLARSRERELAATHALNRGLLQATFNLEDAQAAVTNAFTGLRAAIDKVVTELQAKLSVANEAVNRSRSIFNQLESALSGRSLTSGIGQTFARREGALGFLRGGDFSDERKLDEALRVVSEPTEDLFGSFVDYAREFATTSRTLEEAKNVAQTQLTADEQQVMLLEQQIASTEAQYQVEVDQYNALMGIDTSVKSVGDAIATLRGAIEGLASAQAAAKAAASAPSAAATAGAVDMNKLGPSQNGTLEALAGGGGRVTFPGGGSHTVAGANGLELLGKAYGFEGFAAGGMHSGGMRLVGEEGPELEVTGPSRIYSKQQTKELLRGGDSSDGEGLRAEVSEMRQELRQLLIANNKYTKRSYDLYNKWDIDGLPAERT